jgi:hypothetical protein
MEWSFHFDQANDRALSILYLLRDNVPSSFMLQMEDGEPCLSWIIDVSSLHHYQRAMLRMALQFDAHGDVFYYVLSQEQRTQPLAQFWVKLKDLTSILKPEKATPQLCQDIFATLNHNLKEWMLSSNLNYIDFLPPIPAIYKAVLAAQNQIKGHKIKSREWNTTSTSYPTAKPCTLQRAHPSFDHNADPSPTDLSTLKKTIYCSLIVPMLWWL